MGTSKSLGIRKALKLETVYLSRLPMVHFGCEERYSPSYFSAEPR